MGWLNSAQTHFGGIRSCWSFVQAAYFWPALSILRSLHGSRLPLEALQRSLLLVLFAFMHRLLSEKCSWDANDSLRPHIRSLRTPGKFDRPGPNTGGPSFVADSVAQHNNAEFGHFG